MYGPEYERIISDICRNYGIAFQKFGTKCIALTYCGETHFIWSRRFPHNTATAAKVIDSKCMCSDILEANNISNVRHIRLYRSDTEEYSLQAQTSQSICEGILQSHGGVVIKPNDSCEGINVFVCYSPKEIETSLFKCFQVKSVLAAAPYIAANAEYRVFYLNGEILLIYKKNLPEVIGDGSSTLRTLINKYGLSDIDFRNNLDLTSIPSKGEHMKVGWKFNLSRGSVPEELDRETAPSFLCELAVKAARAVNANFATIDLLEDSSTQQLSILEINAGVAMDQFIIKHPAGREIAYKIYDKAIRSIFHINT